MICIWLISDLAAKLGNPCLIRLILDSPLGQGPIGKLKSFLIEDYHYKSIYIDYKFLKNHMNLAIMNGSSEVVKIFLEYINIEEYANPKTPFIIYHSLCPYPKPCEVGSFIHQAVLFSNMNVLRIIFDDCMKKKKMRLWAITHTFWDNSKMAECNIWHIAARNGKIDFIEFFIEQIDYVDYIDYNVNYFNIDTPIEEAANNGHTEIVKMLMPLSKGPLTTEFDYPLDDESSIARNNKLTQFVDRKIKNFLYSAPKKTNEEVARTYLSFCGWSMDKALFEFRNGTVCKFLKDQKNKEKIKLDQHLEKLKFEEQQKKQQKENVAQNHLSQKDWNCDAEIHGFFSDKQFGIGSLSSQNDTEIQNKIKEFMSITKIEDETAARLYLNEHNWNVDVAQMVFNVESFQSDVKVTEDSETNEDYFNDDADMELSEEISNDSSECQESSSDNEKFSNHTLKCSICEASFQDVLSLNEHVESNHI